MAKKHLTRKQSSTNYSKLKAVGFLKFLALIFPLTAYTVITAFVFPSSNSGFIAVGIVGSISFGLGFVNIAGHLDDSNLGMELSVILLGLGGIMIGISFVIMYVPAIYTKINEQQVSFYFLIWTVISVSIIFYLFFRGAVKRYMRGLGASKSRIADTLKGVMNFWLYKAANDRFGLKWIYRLNKLYLFSILASGVVHLLFGWSRICAPIVATITVIALACNLPMWSLVISTWKQGSSNKKGGYSAHLFAGYLLPIGAIIATIMFALRMVF